MYIPGINRLEDKEEIFRFIKENPFAIIVNTIDGKLTATHMVVELEEDTEGNKILRSHLAKANPQWKNFSAETELLVIFNGPHTYISSSWYDHVNVPTWNYIAIHVYGKPKILDDTAAYALLDRLVKRYEQASEKPFTMGSLSDDYLQSHLKALVAFEISMDRIEAKQKLSQNRDAHNFDRVLEKLDEREDAESTAIKQEMERIKKDLFKH